VIPSIVHSLFRATVAVAVAALSVTAFSSIASDTAHPPGDKRAPTRAEKRWDEAIAAFAAADLRQAPAPGGVVFVGSSSIRLWNDLDKQFDAPVVNRGFGGSRLSDCVSYVDRLVVPHQPRLVFVYAGDNDLAEGRAPEEVATQFTAFVERVRASLPDTRIAYISIKPSPARKALLPQIRVTNALIRDYTATHANLDFIDVFTPMLSADGAPRGELFRPDTLHLNDSGYALWKKVITPHLQRR
jgi:lysophospholipase L1-like esterase